MKLEPIGPALASFIVEDDEEFAPQETRGRKRKENALTGAERQKKHKRKKMEEKSENIAVLDFETDPFDNETEELIFPFTACLYRESAEPVIIWNEKPNDFVDEVLAAIAALPDKFTVYAHNGGKFDFMFLLHRLRGEVSFKGRGIMLAKVGNHELRDSFHIIPEKLAAYQKDEFDYKILKKGLRNKKGNREKIINYMVNDCRYLLDIVKTFVGNHGFKLSIGQAAMSAMKASGYKVAQISEGEDAYLRHYYFGGRVECLAGPGVFRGEYKLYDVNSMYPDAMANFRHPIGREYEICRPINNQPNENTIFLDLTCKNYGALVGRTEDGETTARTGEGRFKTTIWEYQTALKYGLIEDVQIHYLVDCHERSDFSEFIVPMYLHRQNGTKPKLKALKAAGNTDSFEYNDTLKDDMITKYLLNNSSGKFAQDPRRFKENYITAPGDAPPVDEKNPWSNLPTIENNELGYWIYTRPTRRLSFNNVGTAASITGAARAKLLEAIQNAVDPIYCDTDSLICKALHNTELHPDKLGAWDLEDEFVEVAVAGKKLYACDKGEKYEEKKRYKIRSKGTAGLQYSDILKLIDGEAVTMRNFGPTLTKSGEQFYMERTITATAKPANDLLLQKLAARGM